MKKSSGNQIGIIVPLSSDAHKFSASQAKHVFTEYVESVFIPHLYPLLIDV